MKYFTIKELCSSATAKSRGINNDPSFQVEQNLEALVENILDPLREKYGKPIRVNSGYRSPELNRAVGGAATSQHIKGEAADITGGSKEENRKLFELIKTSGIYDQLIDESNYSWVHVSYKKNGGNRMQILHL